MKDFEAAAAVYRDAIASDREDWMLHYNFGNLLSQFGQPAAAAAEYEFVVTKLPRQRAFRIAFGNALLQSGKTAEAAAQFRAALQIDPEYKPALDALAMAERR
jgi:Tfp pilus assembly protein PilF